MFERSFAIPDVRGVLEHGELIEDYPDATPYPSRLLLGWTPDRRPLHVVVGRNPEAVCFVVTVYEPDSAFWADEFRRRKR